MSQPTSTNSTVATLETYSVKDDIKVIERFFNLPLDYSNPSGPKIRVFARNTIPKTKARTEQEEDNLPFFVFLTGGPGFECSYHIPTGDVAAEAHERGYQTLYVDHRGTGLSTVISHDTLPSDLKTDKEKAEYIKLFRADNIVRDCEEIRKLLLGHKQNAEDQKWTIFGQSFGGGCSMTYLSFHSDGLKECFITGGLIPLIDHPDPAYEALVEVVKKRNEIYYTKYPQDIKRVRDIAAYLSENKVTTPTGGTLSVARFQAIGIDFGISRGIDRVHQLVFRASKDLELFNKLSFKTLHMIEQGTGFDGNPLYAILHEPLYCQGRAPEWSAESVLKKHVHLFDWSHVKGLAETEPFYFTGEMVLSSFFDDFVGLRPFKGVADILARDPDWPLLYDLEQLGKNQVKVSAATYYDDMYVDFRLAQETASKIKNTEQFITNQFVHDGIRVDPKHILQRLFQLSKREYD